MGRFKGRIADELNPPKLMARLYSPDIGRRTQTRDGAVYERHADGSLRRTFRDPSNGDGTVPTLAPGAPPLDTSMLHEKRSDPGSPDMIAAGVS